MSTIARPAPAEQAQILTSLLNARNIALAKPTIASNHHLSLEDLEGLMQRHGWPDKVEMGRAVARLRGGVDQPASTPVTAKPLPSTSTDSTPTSADGTKKPEPFLAALAISTLFTDPVYQRDLDELRVQRMASAYDVALIGIVEVSQRPDGRYAILDGQHRVALVRDVSFSSDDPNPHLVCRIHRDLTVAEESALYHQLNTTRKQLTGWDRWLARRGAGESAVLDIEACAHRHDYTIGMQTAPGVLRATKAAEHVVALGGIALLDDVFATIRAAYGDDQAGLDASIIHALGHVLHSYTRDELDLVRLISALSGVVPRQITARAAAVRELHKGTMDRLTAHVIVERYNAEKGPKVQAFFERVKPLSKTKQDAAARRAQVIREWAVREGIEISGKRIPSSIREAYEAAHAAPASAG